MTIQATTDERELLSRLCDDLATRSAPLYKNAHAMIKAALLDAEHERVKCMLCGEGIFQSRGHWYHHGASKAHLAEPNLVQLRLPSIARRMRK